jgi:transcriptional regulator
MRLCPAARCGSRSCTTSRSARRKDKVTAYAIWGLDLTPFFLLARGDRLVATLYPGWVLVEDAHVVDFEELSALAASLSLETVKTVSARLNCGFVFRKRDRLNRPSACPVCRGQHLGPPRFAVQPA